jgi:hypothetical protein
MKTMKTMTSTIVPTQQNPKRIRYESKAVPEFSDMDGIRVTYLIHSLQTHLEQIPREYHDLATITTETVRGYYDDYLTTVSIQWPVEETNGEYTARVLKEKEAEKKRKAGAKAKREADEMAVYLKVKAKLEGN